MKDLTKQEHYANNGIEPIEIMRKNFNHDEFMGFCKGNVLKYLLRYKDKNGLEDLEKAKIYLNWLIDEYSNKGNAEQLNLFDDCLEEHSLFDDCPEQHSFCVEERSWLEDKAKNFENYLIWKQVLDELRKGE